MTFRKRIIKNALLFFSGIGTLICVLFIYYKSYSASVKINQSNNIPASNPDKTVLYISSYTASFEKLPHQLKGITESFKKASISFDHVSYDYQYYRSEENMHLFYDNLKYKIENHKRYDAVLVSDDPALEFVIEHQEEFFPGIPIVFFSILDKDLALKAASKNNMTGIAELLSISETINFACALNKAAQKIVFIYDSNPSGVGFYKQVTEAQKNFPDLTFIPVDGTRFSKKTLSSILSELSSDTILLAFPITEDEEHNIYFPSQIAGFISSNTSLPVFTCTPAGLGAGFTGGKIVMLDKEAEEAAALVGRILNGKDINKEGLTFTQSSAFLFDKIAFKRFKMNTHATDEKIEFFTGSVFNVDHEFSSQVAFILLLICLSVLLITSYVQIASEHSREVSLKDTQKEILFRAEHDFLTKLPNRHSALVLINQLISSKKQFSIILIDIDDFKNFNDFFTHACGDAIIRSISNRLTNLMIENEFFASRFGGDEFLLVYKNGLLSEENKTIAKVKSVFDDPVIYENKPFQVSASFGIANYDSPSLSTDEIISNADIAMYEAKKQGKNSCLFFKAGMKKAKQDSNDIVKLLEEACANDGFTVLYQPQVNVKTGETYGYEALVRLKNHNLSPAIFIPVAEECGLISTIDRIVTKKVVQQLALWREHGVELKRVSINYSYAQICDTDYPKFVKELLDEYKIDSSLVGIEITESLFIKNKVQAKDVFDEFASIGITLSLDDFGTGYSSLSYLTYLPVETVKIDKSLIDNYLSGNNDEFIKNIARLIHSLDMKLTVEGVEFHWQFEKLKVFHCDYIQGYFFSKPITAAEVESWGVPLKFTSAE